MNASHHPVAPCLGQQVGGATRLLAAVMGLPLTDDIFPASIIAGVLTITAGNPLVVGIPQTELLILGGSAMVTVILAEMDGAHRRQLTSILLLGVLLIPVTVTEAAVAETIETLLNPEMFHRLADLVVLVVAAKTAFSKVGEYPSLPSIAIGLGLVASFKPAGFELIVTPDPTRLLSADAAAGTGVGSAGAVALLAPRLRGNVDIDFFRFGSSAALDTLTLDVLGLMPMWVPVALGVFAVTTLFMFDPSSDGVDLDESVDNASTTELATPNANVNGAVADDGDDADLADYDALVDDMSETDDNSESGYGYPGEEELRTPWL